ncbi:MAG: DUF1788 domain-containing protein [Planctomycetaceae bacterium]|nr:MAG: DUF1788 domain-containing protein [Planctomycetaceae bacterium]
MYARWRRQWMSSLDSIFEELRQQFKTPDALNPAKSDPLFYFVHAPEDTLELKKRIPLWIAKFREDGKEVEVVSFADLLWQIIDASGRWDDWLESEPTEEPEQINRAVKDAVRSGNALVEAVARHLDSALPNRVLFLVDAALVHPYFRLRTLVSGLHDRVKLPAIIFYPGRRSGQYGLRFLGFYPEDPNYRSSLIGD